MRPSTTLHNIMLQVTSMYLLPELWNLCFCDQVYNIDCNLNMRRKQQRRTNPTFCVDVCYTDTKHAFISLRQRGNGPAKYFENPGVTLIICNEHHQRKYEEHSPPSADDRVKIQRYYLFLIFCISSWRNYCWSFTGNLSLPRFSLPANYWKEIVPMAVNIFVSMRFMTYYMLKVIKCDECCVAE